MVEEFISKVSAIYHDDHRGGAGLTGPKIVSVAPRMAQKVTKGRVAMSRRYSKGRTTFGTGRLSTENS